MNILLDVACYSVKKYLYFNFNILFIKIHHIWEIILKYGGVEQLYIWHTNPTLEYFKIISREVTALTYLLKAPFPKYQSSESTFNFDVTENEKEMFWSYFRISYRSKSADNLISRDERDAGDDGLGRNLTRKEMDRWGDSPPTIWGEYHPIQGKELATNCVVILWPFRSFKEWSLLKQKNRWSGNFQ